VEMRVAAAMRRRPHGQIKMRCPTCMQLDCNQALYTHLATSAASAAISCQLLSPSGLPPVAYAATSLAGGPGRAEETRGGAAATGGAARSTAERPRAPPLAAAALRTIVGRSIIVSKCGADCGAW
jgi:hypothetical protein